MVEKNNKIIFNVRFSSSNGASLSESSLYQIIVCNLVYLTVTYRNIVHVVHIVSQFVNSPTTVRWAVVLYILRYFRDTQFQNLLFSSTSSLELYAYSEAD